MHEREGDKSFYNGCGMRLPGSEDFVHDGLREGEGVSRGLKSFDWQKMLER